MQQVRTFAHSLQLHAALHRLWQDPRWHQITYLFSFLLFGILYLGWDIHWARYLTIFSTALLTQTIFNQLYNKPASSLKSAAITGLGMSLLFHTPALWVGALAAFLAIASKFLIQIKGKHIFNPGNFGIIVAITLTGMAWISPGQWGNTALLTAFILITGVNVLLKAGRMDTAVWFLLVYLGSQFGYNVLYKGWPLDFFLHQMTSGTLLIFAFFMITDPVTTPNAPIARIIWAAAVGLVPFLLTHVFYLHTAPLYALFIMCPITAVLDRIFIHERFKWNTT